MRFIYGKQELSTLERAQENCFLLTNGLGGFSSCTMAGSNTRNDHALLMACVKAPNHRVNLVSRLSEVLSIGEKRFWISSQQLSGQGEDGFRNQTSFSFEDLPEWRYQAGGVELIKTCGMEWGANTAAVSYEIRNHGKEACRFTVTPMLQFVRKGENLSKNQEFLLEEGKITSNGMTLFFTTNGIVETVSAVYEEQYYAYDACDGRRETGTALANHRITVEVPAGGNTRLDLVYFMEDSKTAQQILDSAKERRAALAQRVGFRSPAAKLLAKSADQFIAHRKSTGGKTILAGYPFFEDWGRDTMIALPGCTLSAGRFETAKSILRTFMANECRGLMPNLFPEGGNEPAYNTVDAALLFINCVYLYYQKTRDLDFVREAWSVMTSILSWYRKGTDYGIHMDSDGLLMAGQGLDQVTWMDVRVGEILPTPRHGKPVEINAYWYNALRILEELGELTGGETPFDLEETAEQVKKSFLEKFWMEDQGCLKDVLSGTKADTQIRCNQIWAVSMPYSMLDREQGKAVVRTVYEKLYTPYGLRTLDPADPEFQPNYGGPQLTRDLAYHQGTVWTFPLGAYYLAYLRVHENTQQAAEQVAQWLEPLECALREGCVGQLPEIYDGLCPTASRGCFAQAWSVGEILRVYEALEQIQNRMEQITWKKN